MTCNHVISFNSYKKLYVTTCIVLVWMPLIAHPSNEIKIRYPKQVEKNAGFWTEILALLFQKVKNTQTFPHERCTFLCVLGRNLWFHSPGAGFFESRVPQNDHCNAIMNIRTWPWCKSSNPMIKQNLKGNPWVNYQSYR